MQIPLANHLDSDGAKLLGRKEEKGKKKKKKKKRRRRRRRRKHGME